MSDYIRYKGKKLFLALFILTCVLYMQLSGGKKESEVQG